MKSPEPEPAESLNDIRFIERADVINEIANIKGNLETLNTKLGHSALNGSVLFGLNVDEDSPIPALVAGTIAIANVEKIAPYRVLFNKNILEGRKVDLIANEVGDSIRQRKPLLHPSLMNLEEDITYSYPLFNDQTGNVIGAVQQAFYYDNAILPDESELQVFTRSNTGVLNEITQSLTTLQAMQPKLLTSLELDEPTTSNRYAIRLDIKNLSILADTNYGAYTRYVQHSKEITEAIVKAHCPTALLATIQGKNIIIEFPKYIADDPNNVVEIKVFQNREIAKLSERLQEAHDILAERYRHAFMPKFPPHVSINFGNGYFEKDNKGKLSSKLLHTLKRQNLSN